MSHLNFYQVGEIETECNETVTSYCWLLRDWVVEIISETCFWAVRINDYKVFESNCSQEKHSCLIGCALKFAIPE